MKVIFAHDHTFIKVESDIYTTGTLNYNVWKRYLKNFDKIEVLARIKSGSKDLKKVNKSNGERVGFTNIPNLSSLKGMLFEKNKARKIIEEKISTADVVIVRLPSEIGSLVYDVARENNKKIFVEVVGCPWDGLWNFGGIKGKIYAPVSWYKLKKRVLNAENVIYVTNNFLQQRYPTSGNKISCSNVELIMQNNNLTVDRNYELYKNQDEVVIGLIGNVGNNIKGIDTALNAIKIIKKSYKIKLKILGNGDSTIWNKIISDLSIEKEVEFCGTLPAGEAVYNWLDNLDIYIQPSYQEGLPRAVIEAMSRGCPIVVSDAGGMPELVSEEFVHKRKNYKELATKIIEFIKSKDKRYEEGKRNKNEALKYKKEILEQRRYEFLKSMKGS